MPIRNHGGTSASSRLLKMQELVRIGERCSRHPYLSGQKLSEWSIACGAHCSHFLGKVHHRISRTLVLAVLFVLTILHPVLHQFEGGALDALFAGLYARLTADE